MCECVDAFIPIQTPIARLAWAYKKPHILQATQFRIMNRLTDFYDKFSDKSLAIVNSKGVKAAITLNSLRQSRNSFNQALIRCLFLTDRIEERKNTCYMYLSDNDLALESFTHCVKFSYKQTAKTLNSEYSKVYEAFKIQEGLRKYD